MLNQHMLNQHMLNQHMAMLNQHMHQLHLGMQEVSCERASQIADVLVASQSLFLV
jgi:hypothetical protein